MWDDELPTGKSWAALWSGYIVCEDCAGIRTFDHCPACGSPSYFNDTPVSQVQNREFTTWSDATEPAITISVNRQSLSAMQKTATGSEFRTMLARRLGILPGFMLHQKHADGTIRLIGDSDTVHLHDQAQFLTVAPVCMGAEGGYEDWIYLQMLEREWKRPITELDRFFHPDPARSPSPRAAIVVLFWSYFETRIDRLLRAGMRDVPPRLAENTLQRFSSIGSRLDRLYKILFDTTYSNDLNELGFARIGEHLNEVQRLRNEFAHGNPTAIGDALVHAVVENLKEEHEAWIAVFNRRGTRMVSSSK